VNRQPGDLQYRHVNTAISKTKIFYPYNLCEFYLGFEQTVQFSTCYSAKNVSSVRQTSNVREDQVSGKFRKNKT